MKKEFLYSVIAIGLLGNESALPINDLEVDVTADHIVGSLWDGTAIPKEEIKELFSLKKEDAYTTKKNGNDYNIDMTIKYCLQTMKTIASHRKETSENIANIDNFINNVNELKSEFTPQIIGGTLFLILAKYNG